MSDHRTPTDECPSCRSELDMASSVTGDDAPEPDDVTVCVYCAAILVFGDDLKLTMPDSGRKLELLADDDVAKVVLAVIRSWSE